MDENNEKQFIEEGGKGEQSYVEALDYYFKIKNPLVETRGLTINTKHKLFLPVFLIAIS